MSNLRRAMDRVFEDFMPTRSLRGDAELTFPIDLSETENEVVVKAVLPGVKPNDVDISVTENVLTIKGQAQSEQTEEKENYYRREIRYGAFARSIPLPTRVNHEQAGAEFHDGILTVRLPKAEEVRPKTIRIRAKGEQPELAGAGSTNQSG
jgi:HSP20 family protein